MASNARRSRTAHQGPARKHRPPHPAGGLASRAADPAPSPPLPGALRELLSDPLSGPAIVACLAVLALLLHFYFQCVLQLRLLLGRAAVYRHGQALGLGLRG